MATPKFDRMSVEFSKRIHDPVAAAATDGTTVPAAVRHLFLNQALQEFFGSMWREVRGNKEQFGEIFPELIDERNNSFTAAKYTIISPNLDFFELVELKIGSYWATIRRATQKYLIDTGAVEQMAGDSTHPVAIYAFGAIYIYPTVTFGTSGFYMNIIKKPVDPTTGGYLTQGGSYDSPFDAIHEETIVNIAKQMFDEDVGNTV